MAVRLRANQPAEAIEFHAHAGECRYCDGGVVKMRRDPTDFPLRPDQCWCLQCGQPYYVEIPGSLAQWDQQQWNEKARQRQQPDEKTQ